jgi:MinD superfamily P-loop ATPase
VQLLDMDVEEPNAHLLLRPVIEQEWPVEVPVPVVDLEACVRCGRCAQVCQMSAIAVIRQAVLTFPQLCSGCGACSYVCPQVAITEHPQRVGTVRRGHTPEGIEFGTGEVEVGTQSATPVTRAVKRLVREDRLSLLDAPPGTACPMQETVADSDYCLLITEPTPFGLSDLRVAVETCRGLGVPAGVVINRHGSGYLGVEQFCEQEGLPVLLTIPQDRAIAEAYAVGRTLVTVQPEWKERLLELLRAASDGAVQIREAPRKETVYMRAGTGGAGRGQGAGGGAGAGRGAGQGGGRGRMGGFGLGMGGNCLCPACGYKQPHQRGVPCNSIKCPQCGQIMTRER